MSKPWFDPDSGAPLFDQYVGEMPSFRKIVADEVITNDELSGQARKVASLLQELEGRLSPDEKSLVTEALCELAVLHALHAKRTETR